MAIRSLTLGSAALVGSSVLLGQLSVVAQPGGKDEGGLAGVTGPDVIIGSLSGISKWGTVNGISAYSIGTTSCNIGDEVLLWCDNNVPGLCTNDEHPVIGQNMYRLMDGRLEMIGMSWLKHGFCALSGTLCGPCQATNCNTLGLGCSDPYGSGLNGSQGGLGPRSQVNPTTGAFPYPFSAPPAPATVGRRIQVDIDDLNPAMNPGAIYFGEGHYIAADDAAAGNDDNNAAYRRMNVGSLSGGAYNLTMTGPTFMQKAAIYAWQEHGNGVNNPDPDVFIDPVDVDEDGRYLVGYRASDNGDGTWHYEYAIFNMNSERAANSFSVPVPPCVDVSNVGQHIIDHHSGEPYKTDDWNIEVTDGAVTWSTDSFETDEDANALRWGTMFNFRFDADAPPAEVGAILGLFKPGSADDPVVVLSGPALTPPCDLNNDGVVSGADLGILLSAWGEADCAADLNQDGEVDGSDLGILLACWD